MKANTFTEYSDNRDPGWTGLIAAVVVQAVKDARGDSLPQAIDAALWLVGDDAPLFMEAVGMDADPVALLTSGRARSWRVRA